MTTADLESARALVALAIRAATAYERDDLAERLSATAERVTDPQIRVLVVGEFKQGKSSLVNALLGIEVCPIDDDIATSTPTMVRWAPELCATAVYRSTGTDAPRREPFALADLAAHVTEAGNPDNTRALAVVEVGLPATLLAGGLALVDTPGVGGLGSVHSAATMATLPLADAVLFVSDAAREVTESELDFLRTVTDLCPQVLVALTKVDLHPEWRRILALDAMHLVGAGLALDQIPCSALLRELAIESGDRDTNNESGFPALVGWLRDVVADGADRRAARAAGITVADVAAQLHHQFDVERQALADRSGAPALVAALDRAKADAEHARTAGATWQKLLNDGFADASAEIERDLRSRMRTLTAGAEADIDALDPAVAWVEFEPRLYRQVAASVGEHLGWRHRRLATWVDGVAAAFAGTSGDVGRRDADHLLGDRAPADVGDPSDLLAGASGHAELDLKRMHLGGQALSLLRSSYGGIAMFGALGGLAGIVVATPAIVGVGLLLGGKGLFDEKSRQLTQRRAQAKVVARRYLDEVNFALGNDQRDTLRAVQRVVRDHYTARASELATSARAALDAANAAVRSDGDSRAARLAFVEAELAKIAVVGDRADALLAALAEAERAAPPEAAEPAASAGVAG